MFVMVMKVTVQCPSWPDSCPGDEKRYISISNVINDLSPLLWSALLLHLYSYYSAVTGRLRREN